jgi:uncharacterized protein YndB with AHSA1/START domain
MVHPALAGDEKTSGATATSASERRIVKEVVVSAPRSAVWKLWTTSDGPAEFVADKAEIELRLGGRYEWLFDRSAPEGARGSEGCTVLSFIPLEMLAFTWNAPPSIPELRDSGARTQVVVRFAELQPDTTRVTLTQHGFGEGEAWERYITYFERAWEVVLTRLKEHCERSDTFIARVGMTREAPRLQQDSWTAGHVRVTAIRGAETRQDFELTVPAAVEDVWQALATTAGYRRYLQPEAEIELKSGGRYGVWAGAPNKVLAFVPGEMLSISGSAPPQFPNVRQGGTWSAYTFEPADEKATRLRLSVVGWRAGEKEWDEAFDYFLKNNALFLNTLHERLAQSAAGADPTAPLLVEGVVDAPVEQVWSAFTTKQGLESWMVAMAEIDLRVGGKMLTKYKNEGVLGDEGTIENTILSFEPNHMISIKATKPPAGFPFMNAIQRMWTIVYFEPLGDEQTRVRCVGVGFGDDEESRKMRAHFDHGNAWTLQKLAEHFRKEAR